MFRTNQKSRDAFTFSLGGITTVASFVAPIAVANDRHYAARVSREKSAAKSARSTRRNGLRRQAA